MKTIMLQQLVDLGACERARTKFEVLFGQSVEVTEAVCLALANEFDWAWAAKRLLTPSAKAEYDRIVKPVQAEYDRIVIQAWAEFNRISAATFCKLFNAELDS